MSTQPVESGCWTDGKLPANVRLGTGTIVKVAHAFKRFRSVREPGLVIGEQCTMDGVHFAIGRDGLVTIGDYCYFTNATLLCEAELRIGNCVFVGWNASIADTDFHPVEPAERILDAIACSPRGGSRPRPAVSRLPVIIEDDVWIGPNATILKGVRVGSGALVEAGSLVTRDVPARCRVLGNPAQIVGQV